MRRRPRNLPFALVPALVMAVTAPVVMASESSMATGKLSVEGPDATLVISLNHAYYVSGPNRFDETKTVRSIVFTADDQRAAINACPDMRCAMLSSSDGLQIEIGDDGAVNWWAHVAPIQYSSTASGDALKLSVDSAGRVAGSFKLGGSGATAAVEFDASLIRDFSKTE
ncbi:hypothetical protein [Dokdonella sp.]|uniref:hypothetical protein n=1 Tax=Dokdonella sp. TaxID=2291710 RepID=UPI003527DBB4